MGLKETGDVMRSSEWRLCRQEKQTGITGDNLHNVKECSRLKRRVLAEEFF